jgi:hypothetical protein
MTFQIQLREYISKKPKGDRDMTGGSDCSDYEVVLINGKEESVLKKFSGFDNFRVGHKEPQGVRKEAMDYLKTQAKFFGATVLELIKFRPRPAKTEWVQEGE